MLAIRSAMKITYVERNGRRYAYTYVSARVPGRRNPVIRTTYLGVVDPETGEIVGKRGRRDPDEPRLFDGGFKVRDLGDVLIADACARRLGLPDDLRRSFGDHGDIVLALVLAQAIRPSGMDGTLTTMASSCIPEVLGIGRGRLGRRVSEALRAMDFGACEGFFRSRIDRCEKGFILCGRTIRLLGLDPNSESNVMNGGAWKRGDSNIQLFADTDGNPVAFDFNIGPTVSTHMLESISDESLGRCLVVSDSYMGVPSAVADLVSRRMTFAALADRDSEISEKLTERLSSEDGNLRKIEFNGRMFDVLETSVGLTTSEHGWAYVTDDDHKFSDCHFRIGAFVCRDLATARFESDSFRHMVSNLKREVAESGGPEDIQNIVSRMDRLKDLVDVVDTGEGYRVRVRRKEMSRAKSRAGTFVILSTLDRCEEAFELYRSRRVLFSQLGSVMDGLMGRWGVEGGPRRIYSALFIRFLAAMVRSSIREALGADPMLTVDEALKAASSYSVAVVGDRVFRSSIEMRAASVLRMFDIDVSDPFNSRGERPDIVRPPDISVPTS